MLYGCETWILIGDLERRIEAFGNKCLRSIMRYSWFYRVKNLRLPRETGSRPIACTMRHRQLMLYGNVASFLYVDPEYRTVFERDNPGWRRPIGRAQSSWLGKVDEFSRDVLGRGRGPACRLAQRKRREWRHRVKIKPTLRQTGDVFKRFGGHCHHLQ